VDFPEILMCRTTLRTVGFPLNPNQWLDFFGGDCKNICFMFLSTLVCTAIKLTIGVLVVRSHLWAVCYMVLEMIDRIFGTDPPKKCSITCSFLCL